MINKVEMLEARESGSSYLSDEIGKSKRMLQDNRLLFDHLRGIE